MRGQALAIALVIASGIAMLVMSQATLELRETRARLYSDYRLSHVWANVSERRTAVRPVSLNWVASTRSRPDCVPLANCACLTSVTRSRQPYCRRRKPESGQNRLYLRSGRLLDAQADDEMLVSDAFAQAHRLRPGASH